MNPMTDRDQVAHEADKCHQDSDNELFLLSTNLGRAAARHACQSRPSNLWVMAGVRHVGPVQDALATVAAQASQAYEMLLSSAMPLVLRYGSLEEALSVILPSFEMQCHSPVLGELITEVFLVVKQS